MPTLDWLDRQAAFSVATKTTTHVLRPHTAGHIFGDATAAKDNLLIQGDNLQALKALLPFYRGQVKCIFIDPPYNTKSAFEHYDDNLEHSQWLSMMLPRLQVLRDLLREDGSIWVTIDDNEGHYLKVMMDEVFGRGNFVATIAWEKDKGGRGDADISTSQDMVLAFAKKKTAWAATRNLLERTVVQAGRFKNPDNDPRGPWRQGDDGTAKSGTEKQRFPITLPSGRVVRPKAGRFWAFSEETFAKARTEGRAYFGKDGNRLPLIKRYLEVVREGNEMRQKYGNSVLAQLAIKQIATVREQQRESGANEKQLELEGMPSLEQAVIPAPVVRHCHVIDSIKNTDELQLLRSVYGRLLHVISVYSPIDLRTQELEKKLGGKVQVYELIDRDSGEEIENGQSVRDVFPQADFFLRINDGTDDQIRANLARYLDLLLGVKVITPTADERAMYEAHSAARNSACLSRQVGAAITDDAGEVLSVGWNDVPRAFGGLYESFGRPGESTYVDHRCWNKDGGKCFNDEEKSDIAGRLTKALIKEGIVPAAKETEVNARLRSSSEVLGLIEFSRAVHAEMHAILNAGHSSGARVMGGKLYVTTYPCHSCARHIIAAGIKEVRFIEPYRKSLATRLHADAITESESEKHKVRIVPFDGVAPTRFLDLFTMGPSGRKDKTGKMLRFSSTIPVTAVTLEAVTTLEELALRELQSSNLLG